MTWFTDFKGLELWAPIWETLGNHKFFNTSPRKMIVIENAQQHPGYLS